MRGRHDLVMSRPATASAEERPARRTGAPQPPPAGAEPGQGAQDRRTAQRRAVGKGQPDQADHGAGDRAEGGAVADLANQARRWSRERTEVNPAREPRARGGAAMESHGGPFGGGAGEGGDGRGARGGVTFRHTAPPLHRGPGPAAAASGHSIASSSMGRRRRRGAARGRREADVERERALLRDLVGDEAVDHQVVGAGRDVDRQAVSSRARQAASSRAPSRWRSTSTPAPSVTVAVSWPG
jgi:hypothetical protein